MLAILKRNHIGECTALEAVSEGQWSTPWWVDWNDAFVWRDAIGRRTKHPSSGRLWLRLRCNSINGCPAEKLVLVADIEVAAGAE